MSLFLSSAKDYKFVIGNQRIYRVLELLAKAYCKANNIPYDECVEKYSRPGYTPDVYITFPYTDKQGKLKTEHITLFECNEKVEELVKLTEKEVNELNSFLNPVNSLIY